MHHARGGDRLDRLPILLTVLIICYESSPAILIEGYNYEAALRRLVGEGRLRVP